MVEVTTVRVACPDEPNNLVDDFIYGHLRLVSCRVARSSLSQLGVLVCPDPTSPLNLRSATVTNVEGDWVSELGLSMSTLKKVFYGTIAATCHERFDQQPWCPTK
jgi:hypothetical protein